MPSCSQDPHDLKEDRTGLNNDKARDNVCDPVVVELASSRRLARQNRQAEAHGEKMVHYCFKKIRRGIAKARDDVAYEIRCK